MYVCTLYEKSVNFAQEFLDDPWRNDNVELTLWGRNAKNPDGRGQDALWALPVGKPSISSL